MDAGAAVLAYDRLDVTSNLESIGRPLEALMADGRLRDAMEERLRARPLADAAEVIARTVLGVRGRVSA